MISSVFYFFDDISKLFADIWNLFADIITYGIKLVISSNKMFVSQRWIDNITKYRQMRWIIDEREQWIYDEETKGQ